jgi:N-carbamoylputrescine amidase
MRVTVCELPHQDAELESAWAELCAHTARHASELVLLPELAMVEPIWECERFDRVRWAVAEARSELWLQRLGELQAAHVVGTRPISVAGRRFNEGYRWSAAEGMVPLRRKCFMPNEPGYREARWFDAGDATFPVFHAGALSFGLNICTELWALETYADYTAHGVQIIASPRATAAATTAKWLSIGVVAAVRSGAYSLSSNRVDATGECGGVGWIISPNGEIIAITSPRVPFATIDIDLAAPAAARTRYPCYVFDGKVMSALAGDGREKTFAN